MTLSVQAYDVLFVSARSVRFQDSASLGSNASAVQGAKSLCLCVKKISSDKTGNRSAAVACKWIYKNNYLEMPSQQILRNRECIAFHSVDATNRFIYSKNTRTGTWIFYEEKTLWILIILPQGAFPNAHGKRRHTGRGCRYITRI